MIGPAHTVLWLAWAFVCAYGARLVFTRLFRPWLGKAAPFAAYGMWVVLLLAGWIAVRLSGLQLYTFDARDPGQMWGYRIAFYSTLGLPTLFGAPAVLILDLARALVSRRTRRRPA